MRKPLLIFVLLVLLALLAYKVFSPRSSEKNNVETINSPTLSEDTYEELGINIFPQEIIQGDPVMVQIQGLATTTVNSLRFNGKTLNTFMHNDRPTALIGMDLRMTTGTYPVSVTLSNGVILEEKLVVHSREIVQEPLGIPEKLGGNTEESEKQLVSTLAQEGAIISAVPSRPKKLWNGPFRVPVNEPVFITDTYGYSRLTGASSISHKGTDYRAKVGTPIYAMNSGEVRFNQFLRNYGNTVIVDHGLGLHTIYMHLSESQVTLGQMVEKGQMIAKSGDSGYTLGPHLHLTVRINGISIDPEKFLALFVD